MSEEPAVKAVELTADEKVRNGAAFLDRAAALGDVPTDWRGLVDVARLRMRGNSECVLGQVMLKTVNSDDHTGWGWAIQKFDREIENEDLGFNVPWQWRRLDTEARWTALDDAWKRYLTGGNDGVSGGSAGTAAAAEASGEDAAGGSSELA